MRAVSFALDVKRMPANITLPMNCAVGPPGEFGFYERRFILKLHVTALEPPSHVAWHIGSPPWPEVGAPYSRRRGHLSDSVRNLRRYVLGFARR
jgi:hypothetical protein